MEGYDVNEMWKPSKRKKWYVFILLNESTSPLSLGNVPAFSVFNTSLCSGVTSLVRLLEFFFMIRFLGSEVRGRISVQAAGADSFRIVCSLAFLRATLA